ncbi:SUKH-3 domain-containing protein [Fulvivirgaceae bacterium PWU4]|uniref:SUKH-3 domain-containing protein n=1 Tax=Chryseosolibacter histidini TaxID=2782349 RepID=A0AAP2DMV1_9BACT|nr:SUKH-3 domain-containing protein [Chryseosolibacter histidini]MBT1699243.1 SUKH-3 domain-containing protein [Chryseosolibacter histidini]
MHKFSDTTQKALSESGWQEDRKIDIQSFKFDLVKEGYPWFGKVESFLQAFGGLNVKFLRSDRSQDFFQFDPSRAVQDIDVRWVKDDYSKRLQNINLCVVGQAFGGHMTLLISEDGKMYGGYDDNLYLIGNDGSEAIENICLNKEMEAIPL